LHRIWAFLAGTPVGILAALAAGQASWLSLETGAAAGGAALLLAVVIAGRFASAEPERGAHLARAASLGLAAAPAAAAAWLGLQPGAAIALGALLVLVAARLVLAARASGPGGGALRQLGSAAAAIAFGAVASLAAAGALAAFAGPREPAEVPASRSAYVYDVDASVALGPEPRCTASIAATKELGAGANPVLTADGSALWFDARDADGRRQLHRLELASGERTCWTCAEPGSNRRPRLAPNGAALLFETDRHATAFDPVNWDLHLISARGSAPTGSRRLSYDPAPDAFGSFDPGGRLVVWSSGGAGRFAIATAPLRSGHGGLLLGAPTAFVPGGAAWIAPLAWSPDARTLVALRGDPFGVQETFALDPATGRKAELSRPDAKVVAASFSADGTSLALATTHPAAASAALPEALGFLVGRVASLRGSEGARFRGSGVRIGAPWAQELAEVELGEIADFGSPAGIALAPDARSFVLAQRRSGGGAEEAGERMLRVDLDCP
jgi:hypothetical protein